MMEKTLKHLADVRAARGVYVSGIVQLYLNNELRI